MGCLADQDTAIHSAVFLTISVLTFSPHTGGGDKNHHWWPLNPWSGRRQDGRRGGRWRNTVWEIRFLLTLTRPPTEANSQKRPKKTTEEGIKKAKKRTLKEKTKPLSGKSVSSWQWPTGHHGSEQLRKKKNPRRAFKKPFIGKLERCLGIGCQWHWGGGVSKIKQSPKWPLHIMSHIDITWSENLLWI